MKHPLNIYSVDTLGGDHLYCMVARSLDEACQIVNPTENITVTDIDETPISKKVLKQIIDEDIDEDEDTRKKLKKRYGIYGK